MSNRKTIRRDWLKRQIVAGKIEIKCTGIYTDDYYGDNANRFQKTDWELADIKNFQDHDFTFSSGYAYQEEDGTIHWTMLANHFYICRVISEEQAEAYRQAKLSTTSVDEQGDLTGFEGVEADEIKELIEEAIEQHSVNLDPALFPSQTIDETIALETSTQPREERIKIYVQNSVKLLGFEPEWFFNVQFLTNHVTLMGNYSASEAEAIQKAGYPLTVGEDGWLRYESSHIIIILT